MGMSIVRVPAAIVMRRIASGTDRAYRSGMRLELSICLLLSLAAFAAAEEPKKPIAVVKPEPSVLVEGRPVLTVAPIRGEGMPGELAISGTDAHDFLRTEALKVRSEVHLYTLSTGMHALSADGESSGWVADFLTGTPGEMVTVIYDEGHIEAFLGTAPLGRPGVPDEATLGYDLEKLCEQTLGHAKGVVDPITRVTASLYRSAGSGKALWLFNVYNDDDRIGTTVVFDASTMKFSHKTK
jgi:hypothetical protein